MNSLDRVGRLGLRWPLPFVGIAAVVCIGGTHPVDDRTKYRNPSTVKLPSGAFDLGRPADLEARSQQGSIGPAAQNQSVRDRQDRRRVDDDHVIPLAKLGDQNGEVSPLQNTAGIVDRRSRGQQMERSPLYG